MGMAVRRRPLHSPRWGMRAALVTRTGLWPPLPLHPLSWGLRETMMSWASMEPLGPPHPLR
jgi:hypothetical protein